MEEDTFGQRVIFSFTSFESPPISDHRLFLIKLNQMHKNLETLKFQGENGRDDFEREKVAEKAIQLLVSKIDISPMIIDGDWGTGKSEFCFKLINKFKGEFPEHKIIYIDAFQADHPDNPLMTLLSAVMTLIEDKPIRQNLLKKALPVMRLAFSIVGKATIAHVLQQNTEEISEAVSDAIKDSTNDAIDSSLELLLEDHENAKRNLTALQETLAGIAKSHPIFIFIDELDRCRPDFSVHMLETIKHIFNVENVSFVLVTNTVQLKAAINHRYGSNVNAQRYLDKFIKFSFKLPNYLPWTSSASKDAMYASSYYFTELAKQSEILKTTVLAEPSYMATIFATQIIQRNNLSLREVELFIRNLEIYEVLTGRIPKTTDLIGLAMLIVIGIYISCFLPEVSQSIQNNVYDGKVLFELISGSKSPTSEDPSEDNYIEGFAMLLARKCNINNNSFKNTVDGNYQQWRGLEFKYFGTKVKEPIKEIKDILLCLRLAPERR